MTVERVALVLFVLGCLGAIRLLRETDTLNRIRDEFRRGGR